MNCFNVLATGLRAVALTTPLLGLLAAGAAVAQVPRTPATAGASVYIISPKDGDTVSGELLVRFGLRGMGVAPVGVDMAKTGHHHLLIDVETPPAADQPIPADARHLHFGGGQTETTLKLAPGRHTLQLLLGDKNHIPHDPPLLSEKITITVQ